MDLDTSGLSQTLLCIEYPGIVNNVDKMLSTLGGLKGISRVMGSKNRRLELRFRPDDPYCKPACGDRCTTNSLLLSVKVRVKKSKGNEISLDQGKVVSSKIVARIKTTVKFKSLCDFQFLPMSIDKEGIVSNLAPLFLPHDISGDNLLKWFKEDIELFLPPPAFARVDNTGLNSYMYRNQSGNENESSFIRTRKRRAGYGYFVSNNVKMIPTKPQEKAIHMVSIKMLDNQFSAVKKLFEERPVWSKLALMCVTKFSIDVMKTILPSLAYYFVTGPFRVSWVRIGYDPRKDPESKIYQMLDYRMKSFAGLSDKIKAKRPYIHIKPNKTSYSSKRTVVISKKDLITAEVEPTEPVLKGDEYLFTPTSIPHSRQMFYQYVDLKIPEIECMFARLPKTNEYYDDKTGWLPKGFDVHCRDVISVYLQESLRRDIEDFEGWKTEDPDDSTDEEERWQKEEVADEEIYYSDVE